LITLLNKETLYNTFDAEDFSSLGICIDSMAPSMVEYYLSSLSEPEEIYLNKRNIQESFSIGEYHLYKDYNEDIYLEFSDESEDLTQSFW
jgi:hypothetical protein